MNLLDPQPRNRDADCVMHWDGDNDTVILDFGRMPLNKLIQLRQLNEGLNATTCFSWTEAMVSTVSAIFDYFGANVFAEVAQGKDFTIRVKLAESTHPNSAGKLLERFLTTRSGLSVA